MAVTQKDIANNLGVSRELVKFALSGSGRVGAGSRERILQEARRLGYSQTSNRAARSLAARRNGTRNHSNIIALVTSNPLFEGMPVASVPYFRDIVRGIEEVVSHREVDLFFCTFNDTHRPRLILDGGVDGVVCLGRGEAALFELPVPVISFEPSSPHVHTLTPDGHTGARLATEHLLSLGHRRIACLPYAARFPLLNPDAVERIEGYRQALTAAGIHIDERLICPVLHPTMDAGAAGMSKLLKSGATDFTAVVCFNDLIAMGAIEVLRKRGKSVPGDVSVVGFDDVSAQHAFVPRLTSIRFDRFAMGRRAVEIICQLRDAAPDVPSPVINEIFPVELVPHDSTAAIESSIGPR